MNITIVHMKHTGTEVICDLIEMSEDTRRRLKNVLTPYLDIRDSINKILAIKKYNANHEVKINVSLKSLEEL